MTIFIIGSVLETASKLDPKRLWKQILECQWMINMREGKTKPSHHPAYLMYQDHIEWVKLYQECLINYRRYLKSGDIDSYNKAKELSGRADLIKPPFLCEALYINFKRRLYTKDPEFYKEYEELGKSDSNYYYVNGGWWKYTNGVKEKID